MIRFPRGIRSRLTILAAVVTALPLLIGVLVVANLLQRSLTANLQHETQHTAAAVTSAVSRSGPSGVAGTTSSVSPGTTVHVFGSDGRVVAEYPRESRWTGEVVPGDGTIVRGNKGYWLPGDLDQPLSVQARTTYGGQQFTILVQASQEAQHEAVSEAAKLVLICIPFLVGGAAALAWVLTSRTLQPVEAIRRQAERITARNLDERLPVGPAKDEVATLATTMNEMLHRLYTAQESQQRFVADASHELRSPVATLQAALEIAATDGHRVSTENAGLMRREADRLQELIDGLLLLTRSDNRGLVLRDRDVDLDDIVFHHATRLASTTDLTVESQLSPARLQGDPERLDQVVRNLTDNAARHARSWLQVQTVAGDDHVLLTVGDDGTGIAEEDRARVFERFVRLDESRTREVGGSGLGLAIVREIVRAHGGTVQVDRSARGGAQFTVRLPYTSATRR
ncbi:cell wall metabolism sensor histidine kinase WalK [Allobranchiibius sp. GilTou73]|uniref:sensor histidine kinase n=1 Tax=Allobranchiibius sp. GilTou73 TaxID=2904523 RepID=UPI001F311C66|nr:HAMP domain-containing sensor histidine kinase [Allobranchiibius sp. GilTou73]UIJ34269.1 HAMP domain-containing histidine kinase [Allobranchiibius sp. GilTou73]